MDQTVPTASKPSALKKWFLKMKRACGVGTAPTVDGLTLEMTEKIQSPPSSKLDAESLPDALNPTAFAFIDGDYALIEWRNNRPWVRRVWDKYNHDELLLLLSDLKTKMDR